MYGLEGHTYFYCRTLRGDRRTLRGFKAIGAKSAVANLRQILGSSRPYPKRRLEELENTSGRRPGGENTAPEASQMTPRGAKIGPRAAKKHQERLELEFLASFFHSGGFLIDFWPRLGRPEAAKRQPKRPQERPREAQDRPKGSPGGSQKGLKCSPRGTQARY